ncbi:MAG: caspase family protein [Bradyrhizobium sp.]|nr:caspase family protein [Bradyrhizobium sp.]
MRFWIAALSFATLLFSAEAALADKRVAFVVGNGTYKNVPPLPNPPADAKTMASTLRNVGFDVVEGYNLTRDKMTEKLLEFGHKAEGADIAVFYYAGHGIAMGGTNYLLPIDADLKSEADVKLGATINVDTTLDQTMQDAKVKLVFLDACRDNPFAARMRSAKLSRGLTVDSGLAAMNTGQGTLIAFATSPGQTALDGDKGTNSPFTRALVANITRPGIEIQQAMTRVRAQVNEETNKNQMPWGHTDLTGSVYLNPASLPAEAKPDGTKADGAKADGTKIDGTKADMPAAPASDMELEFWRSVKDSNKVEELNAYITNYPNGAFKPLALTRIAKLQGDDTGTKATRNLTADASSLDDEADQVAEDQIGFGRGARRDVQRRLTKLGFDVHVTGKFDDETRNVIKRWQAARGYRSTGFLNKAQHTALLSENLASRAPDEDASTPSASDDQSASHARHHYSGGRHYYRAGGPGAFFGGMMGGLFRR